MPTIGKFRDLLALWHSGVLLSEDVPSCASLLADHSDGAPSLLELSLLRKPVASELDPILARASRELGELPLDPVAASWRSAYLIAGWVSGGEVTPRRGAQHLHRLCLELDVPDALTSFIYFDADYGEGPGPREADEAWFDEQILLESRQLLGARPAGDEGPPLVAA